MTTAIDLATFSDYKVADITLAEWGRRELAIAETEMPALMTLLAQRHQCGHLGLCDRQPTATPFGERDVSDSVVRKGC